jgi:GntR family transcriptional regulator
MPDPQSCLIERDTPRLPKYAVIQKWLSGRIAAGVFARGEQLPSEHELMARFDCSRVTVRQALDNLRRHGMIASQRGKGYFVSRLTAIQDLQRLQSFGEVMAPLGVDTSSDVLDIGEEDAGSDVAEALKIASGAKVTRIERLRIAGGTVVSLDISFFPVDVGERLTKLDLKNEDIFVLLERQLGTELGFADLTIDVAPASKRQANLLGVNPKDQLLRIHRLTHDANGRGIDYERIYARLDAMKFHARLGRW